MITQSGMNIAEIYVLDFMVSIYHNLVLKSSEIMQIKKCYANFTHHSPNPHLLSPRSKQCHLMIQVLLHLPNELRKRPFDWNLKTKPSNSMLMQLASFYRIPGLAILW